MDLRVLGPLEIRVDGATLPPGAPKQQAVLALLAVNAGRVVDLADLVDELWPESPPVSAVENVRSYAANLRRLLASVERRRDRLVRRGSGYLLSAGLDDLDLLAFEDEVRRARAAIQRGDTRAAVRLFADARSRWRGGVLAGLRRGPMLEARCAGIDADRIAVIEESAELYIASAEPERAVALLREHVLAHPLREHAQALLVRSFHEAGDTVGALSSYTAARSALVDQLGIEPGPELVAAHRAVLKRDVESQNPPARVQAPVVPRELPAELGYFVGRENEAAQLCTALLRRSAETTCRPAVVIVYGEGGVGKSALAVHVAHQVAAQFPDGQLYLDLFGFTPGLQPLPTAEALGRMLRGLGVPPHDAPTSEADAAALLRTLTADRRLLLVLDNVRDASQLVPLLPATATCAVFATCRGSLAAVDAESRLQLAALSTADGVALLQQLAGGPVDRPSATRLMTLCDHLPLAIRIAAGRLIGRPDLSIGELLERLADHRRRLDELELDGLAVRSCIRVGYEALTSGTGRLDQMAARAFRALGLLKVPTVQPGVVAAMLAEHETDVARDALDRLVDAQLLEPAARGHYRLHDLVRLVAAEQVVDENDEAVREESVRRAMSYYLGSLRTAVDLVRPGRVAHLGDAPEVKGFSLTTFPSTVAAAEWIRGELPNLLAAAAQASRIPGYGGRFTLYISYFTALSTFPGLEWWKAGEIGRLVLDTAERHNDREMAGWGHLMIGRGDAEHRNDAVAVEHFEQALTILRGCNEFGAALALNACAIAADLMGRPAEAIDRYAECLALAQGNAFWVVEGIVCFNLGNLYATLDQWALAREYLERCLAIRRANSDRNGEGGVLAIMAVVHCHNGDYNDALQCVEHAVVHLRETGESLRECTTVLVGAEVELRRGAYAEAMARAKVALSVARSGGHRYGEAAALRQIAKTLAAAGRQEQAEEMYGAATALFNRISVRLDRVLELLFTETDQGRAGRSTSPVGRAS